MKKGDLDIRVLGKTGSVPEIRVVAERENYPPLPVSQFGFPGGHTIWGHPERAHVKVSLSQTAYTEIMRHAASDRFNEVGGLLLGRAYTAADDTGYHVLVERALPDHNGVRGRATYAFTHESWAALVDEVEKGFPALRIVGWFHSHPNYSIFYSGTDANSHRTYFNSPWRIGLVVDPIRNQGGFFALPSSGGEAALLPGFYERLGQSVIDWNNWPAPKEAPVPKKEEAISGWHRPDLLSWKNVLLAVAIVLVLGVLWFSLRTVRRELDQTQAELRTLRAMATQMSLPTSTPTLEPTQSLTPTPIPTETPFPTLTSTLVPVATATVREYTVQPGDNLYRIAQRYEVSVDALMQLNGLNTDHIVPGQVLRIPQP